MPAKYSLKKKSKNSRINSRSRSKIQSRSRSKSIKKKKSTIRKRLNRKNSLKRKKMRGGSSNEVTTINTTKTCVNIENGHLEIEQGVTHIQKDAFEDSENKCSGLKTVTIPNTVTTIGDYAFYDNDELIGTKGINATLNIPNSVKTIGLSAFELCTKLINISISENSKLTSIGKDAFKNCQKLESIIFPTNENFTTIGNGAFGDCHELRSITIPNSVTTIGTGAFKIQRYNEREFSYLTSVILPINENFKTIEAETFYGCDKLEEITIPDSVTTIGKLAFKGCKELTTVNITENSNLNKIEEKAFRYCPKLSNITIENLSTEKKKALVIGSKAFGHTQFVVREFVDKDTKKPVYVLKKRNTDTLPDWVNEELKE